MNHPKLELDLKKHIKDEQKEANVIGAILSQSKFKNSLVLYLVLGNNEKLRSKSDFYMHGVFIDYFKSPFKQVKHNFKKEMEQGKFDTADLFANCKILYQKGRKLDFLIKMAKLILKKKKPR
jgi:hypothetical protein